MAIATSSTRTDRGYVQACHLEAGDRIDIDGRILTVTHRGQLGAWGIELELIDDAGTSWTDPVAAHEEYALVNDD